MTSNPLHNRAGIIFGGYRGAGDLLRVNAEILGRQTGMIFGTTRLSWRALNARACRFANALRQLGIQRGDRVALFARNSHQWVEALFGLNKLGAIAVTVNYRLAAPEVEYIVTNAGARAIICGAAESATARTVANQVRAVQWLIGINHTKGDASGSGIDEYETLIANAAESEPAHNEPFDFHEPALLLYTSGTTGFPKGAVYTHGSLLVGMYVHAYAIGSQRTHRVMLPSPLYSAAGIAGIYCAVLAGSQIALINFDAQTALQTLADERITFTNFVPTTIQMLLNRVDIGQYDLSALEVLLYGGSPIPEPVLRDAMQRLPNCGFRQTFAATETGCSGTVLEPREHRAALDDPALTHRLLSCGRPQLAVEVDVFDDTGNALPANEIGEIGVRTEANMQGYWDNPAATAKAMRNGWVFTGDLARKDEDGYLYLVDRKNDLIVTGALNVYPSEVERVLQQHPAVYECAVIGVPSAQWGEAVKAIVAVRAGMAVTESELIAYCEGKIAGFKKPKSVDFVEKLPRNLTGKILRRELREQYWQDAERRI